MQDFGDFELWVIGDGCTDDSELVAKSFNDERVNWHNLPFNTGSQYAPNNEGLRRSRGKYIAYLGHDDLWFPDHLKKLISHLESEDFDFVHGLSICIKPSGFNYVIGSPPQGRTYLNSHIPPSSWLHKKSIVEKYGYWADQKKISTGADQEYLNRIAKMGGFIGFVSNLFVFKFVSHDWGLYARTMDFPQIDFYCQIKLDADKALKKVLIDSANSYSSLFAQQIRFKRAVNVFLVSIISSLFNLYSRDRWPLNIFLVYWFQRVRKKSRKRRGLKPQN